MALFSQRFWARLTTLDGRVVVTQRRQQTTCNRMLVAQRLVTGAGLEDFWIELRSATSIARVTAAELNQFCVGRSRPASGRDPGRGREVAHLQDLAHLVDAQDESPAY